MHLCIEDENLLSISAIWSCLYDSVKQNTNIKTQLKIDMKLLRDIPIKLWIEVELHLRLGSYVWSIFVSTLTIVLIQTLVMEPNLL